MNKEALIVFVKNPIRGRVKTRLAVTLGNEAAYNVYLKLLDYTLNITSSLACTKFVFYSDFIPENDEWQAKGYHPCLQHGSNLSERMLNAFLYVFSREFSKVLIIGSDCFDLTEDLIQKSFKELEEKDVVVGPAQDGGYYLLGMRKLYPFLLLNKSWSTDLLLRETIEDIKKHQLSFSLLQVLRDVDVAEDLPETFQPNYKEAI